jgi:acetyl esterase/lipase
LVVFIHGGGFLGGDKSSLSSETLEGFLACGFSVAALQYRLTDTAPAPAAYLDCGRAVQTLRARAREWNLDARRFAGTGSSAGAGTSMWLGFHADLANPTSTDPIARESTHFTCLAVRNGQPSYDPRYAERCGIPRPNFDRHKFFIPFHAVTADTFDTADAYRKYEANAAITFLTAKAPPVWMHYKHPDGDTTADSDVQWVVHHPRLGLGLQKQMHALGLECQVHIGSPGPESLRSEIEFVKRHFDAAGK